MSDAYREGRAPAVSPAAYLVTRMPATYAATYSALRELPEGLAPVETILDIGAGTGAASLAARAIFPNAKIEMMERDAALAKEGRAMVPGAELIAADAARVEGDFPKPGSGDRGNLPLAAQARSAARRRSACGGRREWRC